MGRMQLQHIQGPIVIRISILIVTIVVNEIVVDSCIINIVVLIL
jgi:hypothetical protein